MKCTIYKQVLPTLPGKGWDREPSVPAPPPRPDIKAHPQLHFLPSADLTLACIIAPENTPPQPRIHLDENKLDDTRLGTKIFIMGPPRSLAPVCP